MKEFAKSPGESWLIYMLPGATQMEVKDKDDAIFTDDGIFIFHNDPCKTTTFVPRHAVVYIRTWFRHGRVVEGSVRDVYNPIAPVASLPSSSSDEDVVDAEVVG